MTEHGWWKDGEFIPTDTFEEAVDSWRRDQGFSSGGTYKLDDGRVVDTSRVAPTTPSTPDVIDPFMKPPDSFKDSQTLQSVLSGKPFYGGEKRDQASGSFPTTTPITSIQDKSNVPDHLKDLSWEDPDFNDAVLSYITGKTPEIRVPESTLPPPPEGGGIPITKVDPVKAKNLPISLLTGGSDERVKAAMEDISDKQWYSGGFQELLNDEEFLNGAYNINYDALGEDFFENPANLPLQRLTGGQEAFTQEYMENYVREIRRGHMMKSQHHREVEQRNKAGDKIDKQVKEMDNNITLQEKVIYRLTQVAAEQAASAAGGQGFVKVEDQLKKAVEELNTMLEQREELKSSEVELYGGTYNIAGWTGEESITPEKRSKPAIAGDWFERSSRKLFGPALRSTSGASLNSSMIYYVRKMLSEVALLGRGYGVPAAWETSKGISPWSGSLGVGNSLGNLARGLATGIVQRNTEIGMEEMIETGTLNEWDRVRVFFNLLPAAYRNAVHQSAEELQLLPSKEIMEEATEAYASDLHSMATTGQPTDEIVFSIFANPISGNPTQLRNSPEWWVTMNGWLPEHLDSVLGWIDENEKKPEELSGEAFKIVQGIEDNIYELYESDPSGETIREMSDNAYELMVESWEISMKLAGLDSKYENFAFRHSQVYGPDAPERFDATINALAMATLQKGEWLSYREIEAITDRFTDTITEVFGGLVWDWTNFIPGPVIDAITYPAKVFFRGVKGSPDAMRGLFRWTAKEFPNAKIGKLAGHVEGDLLAASARTNMSMAGNVGEEVIVRAGMFNKATVTVRSVLTQIIGTNNLADLSRFNIGQRQIRQVMEGLPKLLGEGYKADEILTLFDKGVDLAYDLELKRLLDLTPPGQMTKKIREIAEINARLFTENIDNVLPSIKSTIEDAVILNASVYGKSGGPLKNTILGTIGELSVKKGQLQETIAKMVKSGVPQAEAEMLARALQADGKFASGLQSAISGMGWLRGKWTSMILTMRPAFTVINFADSTLRMLLSGGEIFRSIEDIYKALDHNIPGDLPGGFMSTIDEFGADIAGKVANGEWRGFGNFFVEGYKAAAKGKNPLLAPFYGFAGGMNTLNSVAETALRIRVYAPKYLDDYAVALKLIDSSLEVAGVVKNLDETTAMLFEHLKNISNNNPSRMKELARQMVEGRVTRRRVDLGNGKIVYQDVLSHSLFVPQEWQTRLSKIVGEQRSQQVVADITDKIWRMWDEGGIMSDEIIDTILDDMIEAIHTQEKTVRRGYAVDEAMDATRNPSKGATKVGDTVDAEEAVEQGTKVTDDLVESRRQSVREEVGVYTKEEIAESRARLEGLKDFLARADDSAPVEIYRGAKSTGETITVGEVKARLAKLEGVEGYTAKTDRDWLEISLRRATGLEKDGSRIRWLEARDKLDARVDLYVKTQGKEGGPAKAIEDLRFYVQDLARNEHQWRGGKSYWGTSDEYGKFWKETNESAYRVRNLDADLKDLKEVPVSPPPPTIASPAEDVASSLKTEEAQNNWNRALDQWREQGGEGIGPHRGLGQADPEVRKVLDEKLAAWQGTEDEFYDALLKGPETDEAVTLTEDFTLGNDIRAEIEAELKESLPGAENITLRSMAQQVGLRQADEMRMARDTLVQIQIEGERIAREIDVLVSAGDEVPAALRAQQIEANDAMRYVETLTDSLQQITSGRFKGDFLRLHYPGPQNVRRMSAMRKAELFNMADEILVNVYTRTAETLQEVRALITEGVEGNYKELATRLRNKDFPSVETLMGAVRGDDGQIIQHGFDFVFEEGSLVKIRYSNDPRYIRGGESYWLKSEQYWKIPQQFQDTLGAIGEDAIKSPYFGRSGGEEAIDALIESRKVTEGGEVIDEVVETTAEASQAMDEAAQEADEIWRGFKDHASKRFEIEIPDTASESFEGFMDWLEIRRDELTAKFKRLGDRMPKEEVDEMWQLGRAKRIIDSEYAKFANSSSKTGKTFTLPPVEKWGPGAANGAVYDWKSATTNRSVLEMAEELRGVLKQGIRGEGPVPMVTAQLLEDQGQALLKASNSWADEVIEAQNVVNYGGDFKGVNFEGAVPFTNHRMLNYTEYNNIEQAIKNWVIPFYMFPARSLPMWAEMMVENPRIVTFYQRYMQTSERYAIQHHLVNRHGQPLPSTRGYLPIPGTNQMVNYLAPFSFRYLLAPLYGEAYRTDQGYEDMGWLQAGLSWMYDSARTIGVIPYPHIVELLKVTGAIDTNKTPSYPISPQLSLVPPNVTRALAEVMNKYVSTAVPSLWGPEVSWKNQLVEGNVLDWALEEIANGADPYQVTMQAEAAIKYKDKDIDAILEEMQGDAAKIQEEQVDKGPDHKADTLKYLLDQIDLLQAEGPHAASALWTDTRNALEMDQWARQSFGFFTGMFAKEYTDGDVLANQHRDHLNMLKAALNDEVLASIFKLDADIQERWYHYLDQRYVVPKGIIGSIRNEIGWVRSPEMPDVSLYGPDRDERLLEIMTEEQQTRSYNWAKQIMRQEKDASIRALPKGATGKMMSAVWTDYFSRIGQLEANHMYSEAGKVWFVGYKPKVLVWEDIENLFFSIVKENLPAWTDFEGEMEYSEFEAMVEDYKVNVALMALSSEALWSELNAIEWLNPSVNKPEDIVGMLSDIADKGGFAEWQIANDSVDDAVQAAHKALYTDEYYRGAEGKEGLERDLYDKEFMENNPTPTNAEYLKWIKDNYVEGQFDIVDLMSALNDKISWDIQQIQEQRSVEGRQEEGKPYDVALRNTQLDTKRFNVIDSIRGIGSEKRGAFEQAFKDLGGEDDFIEVHLYSAQSEITDMDYYEEQLSLAEQALQVAGLTFNPGPTELKERIEADTQKKALGDWVDERLYSGFYAELEGYWNLDDTDRKAYRKDNPDFAREYKKYWGLLDEYAKLNPEWAKYFYKESESSGGGYSSGYASGGTGSYTSYPQGGYGSGGYGGGDTLITTSMGRRSSLDVRRLPFQMGRGGTVGHFVWPRELRDIVGAELPKRVEEAMDKGEDLSVVDKTFISKIGDKHPEWEETLDIITKTIADMQAKVGTGIQEF